MHILTIPDGIDAPVPVASGRSLEAGRSYLCSNAFVGQMLLTRWRVIINGEMWPLRALLRAHPYESASRIDLTGDWNNQDVWLYRGGGWGDLLMLTPLIRALKGKWPDIRIHVACGNEHHSLFEGIDVIPEPIPVLLGDTIPQIISFEESVESDPAAEKTHIAQLFASRMGIQLDDLRPEYHITSRERDFAKSEYPRDGRKRIAVQFLASGLYRSYPKVQAVILALADAGAEVFIFGQPGQMSLTEPIPGVTNLMQRGFTFRESAAILSTCDSCIAPDSALVHLCSALDIPCVALYGPFPSHLRVSSPKTQAIDGRAPCAPCFFHATHSTEFPANMPCTTKHRCVALEDIPHEDVVSAALKLAQSPC